MTGRHNILFGTTVFVACKASSSVVPSEVDIDETLTLVLPSVAALEATTIDGSGPVTGRQSPASALASQSLARSTASVLKRLRACMRSIVFLPS